MKLKRYGVRALLFVLALIVSLAVPSGTASATSAYDDVVTLTDQVRLEQNSSHGSGRADISSNWRSIFSNCDNWTSGSGSYAANCATANAALSAAFTQGYGWVVVQRTVKQDVGLGDTALYVGDKFVTIVFNPESNANAVFRDSYFGRELHVTGSSYTYGFNIVLNNDSNPVPVVTNGQKTTSFSSDFTILDDSDAFNYWSSDVYFSNIPITYPSGYAGVQIPIEPPGKKYVAMGDSYSSGEGNPAFEYGTDIGSGEHKNVCHRSSRAYPRLLADDSGLNLGSTAFVACSGATTQNVLYGGASDGAWNEMPQISALSDDTEVVTITIGGNDIGFGDFGYECLFPVDLVHGTCDEFTDIYETTIWKINNELPDKLENVYGALLNGAQNANIYVLGYPDIAPYKDAGDPFDQNCGGLYDEFPNNWGDARAAHEMTGLLNDIIENAVDAANTQYSSNRLVYVPVENGAFSGHDTCSSDSYFYGIVFPETEYSIHPNVDGQTAYKEDLSDAMS